MFRGADRLRGVLPVLGVIAGLLLARSPGLWDEVLAPLCYALDGLPRWRSRALIILSFGIGIRGGKW